MWSVLILICTVFFSICLLQNSLAYNLAPEAAHIISDPLAFQDSYFGYTVALQKNPLRYLIIVEYASTGFY